MRFPSKATVALLRQRYPVGTRVELVQIAAFSSFV